MKTPNFKHKKTVSSCETASSNDIFFYYSAQNVSLIGLNTNINLFDTLPLFFNHIDRRFYSFLLIPISK